MLNKNKILPAWYILEKNFLRPLSFGFFLVFLAIGITDSLQKTQFSINTSFAWSAFIVFSFLSFFLWYKNIDSKTILVKSIKEFSQIIFFITIFLIAIQKLIMSVDYSKTIILLHDLDLELIIAVILSGFLTIHSNQEKIQISFSKHLNSEKKMDTSLKKMYLRNIIRCKNSLNIKVLVYILLTFALFAVGYSIRVYKLGDLGLWWDELYTGTYVTRILETGLPSYPSNLGYYWRGVTYHYLVSVFIIFFKKSEFWLRFPSVIFGMGIIALAWFYTKKINKYLALLVLFFLIFSSYNIEYSRFARFYIMNAFLFVLSAIIFYKGFFEEKTKYKIGSIIIFFTMIETVQLSSIFLSYILCYSVFSLKNFVESNLSFIAFIRTKITNGTYIFIFLALYFLGNVFERFFNFKSSLPTALSLGLTEQPVNWSFFSTPKWELFTFFDHYYIPLGFIIFSLIFTIFFFLKIKNNKNVFIIFLNLSLYTSILLYEIGSRNVYGPRIYLFAESLMIVSVLIPLYLTLNSFQNMKKSFILMTALVIILTLSIRPYFFERVAIKYGDDITNDPFRTTEVAAYRADYKTTAEFIAKNIKQDDLYISVVNSSYYNIQKTPDYILNENIRWNTDALVGNNQEFIEPTNGSILINSAEEISKIIDSNKEKQIWLSVNGGSLRTLRTTHVRNDFINFLATNNSSTVYISPDNVSAVLLFNRNVANSL